MIGAPRATIAAALARAAGRGRRAPHARAALARLPGGVAASAARADRCRSTAPGAVPGHGAAAGRARDIGAAPARDADVPLRRPGRRGRGARCSTCCSTVPAADARLRPHRLRPARHRALAGCCAARALERDPRLRSTRGRRGLRAPARRRGAPSTRRPTRSRTWRRSGGGSACEKLTLFGISYGTELALAYARAHPDHVERLILDSVVDPDDADPFGPAGFRAMAPTLRALCPDALPRAHARPRRATSPRSSPGCGARRCAALRTTAHGGAGAER